MANRNESTDSRRAGKPYKPEADNEDVAKPTARFAALHDQLRLIHTLLGGTDAMAAAGRKYLPQHDYESDGNYKARLNGTVLDNFVETTLGTWVGKAFAEPPQPSVKDGPAEVVLDFMEDVDGAGSGFVPFAKEWFKSGLRDREAYAMVDFTAEAPLAADDPKARTKAADASSRVVWRVVEACDMLEYREEQVGARTVCALMRFRDDRMVPVLPWGEALEERVKVVRPGAWDVYTKVKAAGGKVVWRRTDGGAYDAGEVRAVRFCVGEERPPLDTLAHMNRRHWESSADQNNILRVTRFPILASSGIRNTDDIVIGPNKFLSTADKDSKIYYVEHTGAAIEQGYKDLERLEDRMASLGAEYMSRDAQGPGSATEAVLDSGEAVSPLRSWVLLFKDCLERALQLTGQWMGLGDDDAGSIDFDMDDGPDPAQANHLQALKDARASRDLSRQNYLNGLKKRGVLEEDFDMDENQRDLDDEPPPAGGGLAGMGAALAGPNGGPPRAAPGAKPGAPKPKE